MAERREIVYKDYPLLFVDDEEMAVVGFTRRYGEEFTVYTATDGKRALETLREHPQIAVIVSDQRMPVMSGVELLSQAKSAAPDAIRMLMTAYTDLGVVIDAINKGNVYRYITKPYNEEEMRLLIIQAIEHYHVVRERDRLYQEKIETMRRMARVNRLSAIGTLAAGMAHEINNPLVAVSTFLQMLPQQRNSPDEEYWTDFYGVAVKEVNRIKTLIAELLSYSKGAKSAELYAREINLEKHFDLNRIVSEVILLLYNEAKRKNIRFELKLTKDLPQAKMDEERIRQVIVNLVLNGIQATEGGAIILSTSYHHGEMPYLELVIADTGIGISEENMEGLFHPFFTTKHEGTGLGLMTCHHIIDQHRGSIDVRSKPGKGTQVIVQIPVDPMKHDRRRSARERGPQNRESGF